MSNRQSDPDGFLPEDPSCWIAPDGKVTFVGDHVLHSTTAKVLGDETGGRGLEGKGYLHISYSSVMKGYDEKRRREIEPTQAQLDSLFDIVQRVEAVLGKDEYTVVRYMRFIADNAPKEDLS